MNVFAINFSPKKFESNTDQVLKPFLQGFSENLYTVDSIYASDFQIKRCLGQMSCHYKTPGKCRLNDDFSNIILDKAVKADYWVFAFPIYADTSPGIFNDTILRLIMPLVEPFIELVDGHFRHPARRPDRNYKVIFITSSGYPDSDRYEPLWQFLKKYCNHRSNLLDFKGIIFRPSGSVFSQMLKNNDKKAVDIQMAAKNAACELVHKGDISQETLQNVRTPLISEHDLSIYGNKIIEGILNENINCI